MLIAGIIFWRVRAGGHPKPYLLGGFATLVFFSGILCFVLEKDWFIHLNWKTKVPLYGFLGISVTFALIFAIVDLINYCAGACCQDSHSRPIVETESQVRRRWRRRRCLTALFFCLSRAENCLGSFMGYASWCVVLEFEMQYER